MSGRRRSRARRSSPIAGLRGLVGGGGGGRRRRGSHASRAAQPSAVAAPPTRVAAAPPTRAVPAPPTRVPPPPTRVAPVPPPRRTEVLPGPAQHPHARHQEHRPVSTPTVTAPVRPAPRAPVLPGVAPGPRSLRRHLAAEEKRRLRGRRMLALCLVALVVAGVAAAAALHIARNVGAHHPTAPPRTQTTLLFQLQAPNGKAVASALLAADRRTGLGVEVLIPSQVIAEVPGYGSEQFGSALGLPNGPAVSRDTTADLMDVLVDQSWVLDQGALARLVDRLGGVSVNVDTAVYRRLRGGGAVQLLSPGRQTLSGRRAVIYATYQAGAETPLAELPRLQRVLDGVLTAMPRSRSGITALLHTLGRGSQASAGARTLAVVLARLIAAERANNITYSTLPVNVIDTGGGALYGIDAARTHALVQADLSDSIPPGSLASGNRVFVENGVGTPGLGLTARDRLVRSGLQFVGSDNAGHFGYRRSLVLVYQDTPAAYQLGRRVARALGLPARDVAYATRTQTIANVIVVLGADYRA